MGRKKSENGLKIVYRTRGDKMYAYTCTSTSKDGIKQNVTTYLGRVNPETKELMEKIPERSKEYRQKIRKQRETDVVTDMKTGCYGGTHLLDAIQRKAHIGEDLYNNFGTMAPTILAISECLFRCRGIFNDVEFALSRSWARNYYGIVGSLDSGSISKLTKKIGSSCRSNIEGFFKSRMERAEGIVAWDTTTRGTYSDMDGMAEYVRNNKDNEDIKQVKTAIATDLRGVPILFRQYPGNLSDMDTVKQIVFDVKAAGRDDVVAAMDRGFFSGYNLNTLQTNKLSYVMPATSVSKAVKKTISKFVSMGERESRTHGDNSYEVWETVLDVVESKRRRANGEPAYDLVIPKEGEKARNPVKLFVCFSPKKYGDEVSAHMKAVNKLKDRAAEIDSLDPVSEFISLAGDMIRYFDVKADGRKANVTVRQNASTFFKNRAGIFVMACSPNLDWELMMTIYDARMLTEQAFEKDKSDHSRFNTSDIDSMQGREFLRFVSLILKCEMAAEIRESEVQYSGDPETIVAALDCIEVRQFGSVSVVTSADKRARAYYEMFKLSPPTKALVDQPVCLVGDLNGVPSEGA